MTLYSAIGGLLTIQEGDVISDVNDNFSTTLLGFTFDEIKNKKVEEILPDYQRLRHQIKFVYDVIKIYDIINVLLSAPMKIRHQ